MSSEHILYGVKGSPFVRKVIIVMAEKNAPYELEIMSPFDPPPQFEAISPLRRIPILRDTSVATEGPKGTIADSSAICQFLEAKYPQPVLYPSDPFSLGRALWFEEYADTNFAAKVGFGLWRTLMATRSQGAEPDVEAARDALHNGLPKYFDYLDGAIEHDFLAGQDFSIADVAVGSQLISVMLTVGGFDAARWPQLESYRQRIMQRPSMLAAYEDERAIMPEPITL